MCLVHCYICFNCTYLCRHSCQVAQDLLSSHHATAAAYQVNESVKQFAVCCVTETTATFRLHAIAESSGAPEAKIAILAEGFVVERAQLAKSTTETDTDFVPASVRSFAHNRAKWELTDK